MHDGPIGNMVHLLENQGVIVARDRLGAVTLDSLSVRSDRPYLMIGTDKGTAVRWRYDAAHELGHLLMHRHIKPKTLTRSTDFKAVEKQAHRFAAAFLLPMGAFAEDFFSASLDALRAIKPKWRVSIAMMIMRARDGGLISDEHQRRLFINYSRRQWRRQEPLDDKLEAEEPHLLRSAIEMVVNHSGLSGSELISEMALASTDIEGLCSLQVGYLRAAGTPTVSLRRPPGEAVIYSFRQRSEHHG
jgi:Zn-dependent peptidase ImmA (M78 family)